MLGGDPASFGVVHHCAVHQLSSIVKTDHHLVESWKECLKKKNQCQQKRRSRFRSSWKIWGYLRWTCSAAKGPDAAGKLWTTGGKKWNDPFDTVDAITVSRHDFAASSEILCPARSHKQITLESAEFNRMLVNSSTATFSVYPPPARQADTPPKFPLWLSWQPLTFMVWLKLKQRAGLYFTSPQQVCLKALDLLLMLLWDQYSGLAWILQPSSCKEVNVETRWHGGKCHVAGLDERWVWGWGGVGGRLTSLMSSSSSAGLQSISAIFPLLVVAAMAITALLPSEGRWGQEGLFIGHQSVSQVTHWSRHEDVSPNKLTLLLLLRHDAVDFVWFRNV